MSRTVTPVLFGWVHAIHSPLSEQCVEQYFNSEMEIFPHWRQSYENWLEWHGPKSLIAVWCALAYSRKKRIYIPQYGWLFWEYSIGFFGSGLAFFKKF